MKLFGISFFTARSFDFGLGWGLILWLFIKPCLNEDLEEPGVQVYTEWMELGFECLYGETKFENRRLNGF